MSKNVRIVMHSHGRGEVFVDGVKVSGVKKIQFSAGVDHANEVGLTFVSDAVEIEGVVDVSTIESMEREFNAAAPTTGGPR